LCGVPLDVVKSGTATVWPVACALARAAVSVMPDPPEPAVPTVWMTRVSWSDSLSMRTVWPVAKPVTFVTLMLVAPALDAAARVAAAWTNLAQYRWVRDVATCSPSALLLSVIPLGGFVLLVPVRIDQL